MKRILIVDDEQLTADTLGIIFRKSGFESRVAAILRGRCARSVLATSIRS